MDADKYWHSDGKGAGVSEGDKKMKPIRHKVIRHTRLKLDMNVSDKDTLFTETKTESQKLKGIAKNVWIKQWKYANLKLRHDKQLLPDLKG